MKTHTVIMASALLLLFGCNDHQKTVWQNQTLASGQSIKITSFNLAWGVEHNDRDSRNDCFAMEYVSAYPSGDSAQLGAEAKEAFELFRPVSEQWGFRIATLAAFPTFDRKGKYDFYLVERQPDGQWTFTHTERKVFSND